MAFIWSSSSFTNKKTKWELLRRFRYNLFKEGISALQGGHQEAQKLIKTTLPFSDAGTTGIPLESVNEKAATGVLAGSSFFISALKKPVEIMRCNSHAFAPGLKMNTSSRV